MNVVAPKTQTMNVPPRRCPRAVSVAGPEDAKARTGQPPTGQQEFPAGVAAAAVAAVAPRTLPAFQSGVSCDLPQLSPAAMLTMMMTTVMWSERESREVQVASSLKLSLGSPQTHRLKYHALLLLLLAIPPVWLVRWTSSTASPLHLPLAVPFTTTPSSRAVGRPSKAGGCTCYCSCFCAALRALKLDQHAGRMAFQI